MMSIEDSFKHKVSDFIHSHKLMSLDSKYLVAISGGADSVALMRVLKTLGYSFEVAHCNFHLRGEESDRDESFCRDICKELGLEIHVAHFATREYAEAHKMSIEMAARFLRYDYFDKLCGDIGASSIVIAHHKDDSAETILMNIIRGTGLHGLLGISPVRDNIIRPLLCVSRIEIEDYLQAIHQDNITDSSNLLNDAVRNKIRLDIIPVIRQINPSFSDTIVNMASRLRMVSDIFDTHMAQCIDELRCNYPNDYGIKAFSIDKISDEYTLYYLLADYGFSSGSIDSIYTQMSNCQTGKMFHSSTHTLLIDRGKLLIQEERAPFHPLKLPIDGHYIIDNSKRLHVETLSFNSDDEIEKAPYVAQIDADKVKMPLTIRNIQPGDKFSPLGMKGKKLVNDFLSDMKINLLEKRQQLIVADANGNIVWVVGKRIDHHFRITKSTKKVIRLRYV